MDTVSADHPAPPHRRLVWRVLGISQAIVAVLTVVVVVAAYNHLGGNIAVGQAINHQVDKHVPDSDEPKEPLNILIMGSDSRDGDGNNIDGLAGGGERSDTTILLHVSANRNNAYGVSLPRDAIIDRPECHLRGGITVPGEEAAMFNTAFAVGADAGGPQGGAQCTVQTVEALTGVYIDHFLVLDFNGFKAMVDAIDGVEVCIPKAVDDDTHNIHFDAGTQTLSGQDALNYVRERYVLSVTGDIGRMKRQQAFIASMVKKVMSAGTLSQPIRVFNFLDAVTSSIEVDAKLDDPGKLAKLAMEFRDTGLGKIKFITVPIAEYPEDPNRLIWTEGADALWQRIIGDQQLGRDFSENSIEADDDVGTVDGDDPSTSSGSGSGEGRTDEERSDRLAAGLCA
ncbi:LCP family protein [Nocardioides sp. R-C-SC26]|uniref:LCP family protein n=1 Tax=Nocardioides sp. R-C-SC26 TaxID=2870414 RepID=UPI0035ABE522